MRNIYEIIAEQKALVDINISKYDLDYITGYLAESQEEYYLEEGLGESIKNAADKVVAIIKKIIEKIKTMARKVINWLIGKKDTKAKLNKKIQDINNGTDSGESTNEDKENDEEDWKNLSREEILRRRKLRKAREKSKKNAGKPIVIGGETPAERKAKEREKADKEQARRKASREAYTKLNDIEAVMKACKGKVKMQTFRNIDEYINLSNKFFRTIPNAEREITNGVNFYSVKEKIIMNTFKREEVSDNRSMSSLIDTELFGDSNTEMENYISIFTDKVMSYLDNGDKLVADIETYEKNAVDNLNKLLIQAQRSKDSEAIRSIQSLSSMVGEFSSKLLSSITKSKNIADSIANKAVEMYRNQIRGGDLPKEN